VSHGVIVGPVVIATAERLVLGDDGTEFALSGPLVLENVAKGTTVKIVYRVEDGLKSLLSVTVLPERQ